MQSVKDNGKNFMGNEEALCSLDGERYAEDSN